MCMYGMPCYRILQQLSFQLLDDGAKVVETGATRRGLLIFRHRR